MADKNKDEPTLTINVEPDPRDEEIARLEAELAALTAPPASEPPADAKDRAIWELKRQLQEKRSTPEGEAEEMRKALDALRMQIERMASGKDMVPYVTPADGSDPYLYGCSLATGELIFAQHPHGTHAHSPETGLTVPVLAYFRLADGDLPRAAEWAAEYQAAHAG